MPLPERDGSSPPNETGSTSRTPADDRGNRLSRGNVVDLSTLLSPVTRSPQRIVGVVIATEDDPSVRRGTVIVEVDRVMKSGVVERYRVTAPATLRPLPDTVRFGP